MWTHVTHTHAVCRGCADCTRFIAPPYSEEKRSPESGYTHTHLFGLFSLPAVIFTGQRVNEAAVTFLWEPSVTGRLTMINFRTGRGDSCKEKARRIRNGPGHHLSPGLAKDTENNRVCWNNVGSEHNRRNHQIFYKIAEFVQLFVESIDE